MTKKKPSTQIHMTNWAGQLLFADFLHTSNGFVTIFVQMYPKWHPLGMHIPLFTWKNKSFWNYANSMILQNNDIQKWRLYVRNATSRFFVYKYLIFVKKWQIYCPALLEFVENTSWKQTGIKQHKIIKKHKLATSQQCEIQDQRNTCKCNVKLHKY